MAGGRADGGWVVCKWAGGGQVGGWVVGGLGGAGVRWAGVFVMRLEARKIENLHLAHLFTG